MSMSVEKVCNFWEHKMDINRMIDKIEGLKNGISVKESEIKSIYEEILNIIPKSATPEYLQLELGVSYKNARQLMDRDINVDAINTDVLVKIAEMKEWNNDFDMNKRFLEIELKKVCGLFAKISYHEDIDDRGIMCIKEALGEYLDRIIKDNSEKVRTKKFLDRDGYMGYRYIEPDMSKAEKDSLIISSFVSSVLLTGGCDIVKKDGNYCMMISDKQKQDIIDRIPDLEKRYNFFGYESIKVSNEIIDIIEKIEKRKLEDSCVVYADNYLNQ